MKVISISTDRKILEEGSGVRNRTILYAGKISELHIILFAKKNSDSDKIKIGNNIWVYPTHSISRWLYVFDAVRAGKKILSSFAETKDVVVTTQDPFETGLVGKKLAQKFQLPLQVQIHTDFLSPYFTKGSLLNLLRLKIAKHVLPYADGIRVVSQRIADSLKSKDKIYKLKTNPVVLPVFIDAEIISSHPILVSIKTRFPQFDFIILVASRITKEKNISLAIKAMQEVIKKYPKAGLVIVGSGEEEKNLKSFVSDLKIDHCVVFEPWNNFIVPYYKTADVFLSTSFYEGYGMTLVEAAISGCVVVTTNVGIASYLLKDKESALIAKSFSAKEIATLIISLIEDKSLASRLRKGAHDSVSSFVLTKEQYTEVYVSTLSKLVKY